jgi:diguanylate cyclase (GGDEF)-like protein
MPTTDVSTQPDFRKLAERLRTTAARILAWRPGIAAQLGIAFVGVALLAAVANFAVQRTISITTTRIVPASIPPAPPVIEQAQKPRTSAVESNATGPALAALERLVHAVETALLTPATVRPQLVTTAARELRTQMKALQGVDAGQHVEAASAAGLEFTEVVTRRVSAFEEYSAALARIDGNLQEGLDKAWKIMGRVVARQSLVAVDGQFKELRREAELLRDDRYSAFDATRLEALEAQFGATLAAGERSLSRNQRADWYARTVEDFRVLGPRRKEVVQLDAQRTAILQRFREQVAALRAELAKAPPMRSAASLASENSGAMQEDGGAAGPVGLSFASPPSWQVFPTESTRHEEQDGGIARGGLAWLSAGVLALLLAVSVGAVLSILRPVQRLIAATQRVSVGELGVRVPEGSGPELDRLATAFNLMAAKLEAAQALTYTYQQHLETRVSERTRQLQHQADHDALTQLPNRRQLFERLRNQIGHAKKHGGNFGLFFVDLDNFKNINDGMGHGFGDRVLLAIAERLCSTVGTHGFAARFGGDEFTVVADLAGADMDELCEFGWALVRAFQRPLVMERGELLVSVSVGGAFYPQHGPDAESLLRAADAAMFRAKALGRSQFSVFTPELLEAAASRFTTEQGLRLAIDRGELELFFQPEMDLATLAVDVCEALLRWRAPGGELVPPDEFLSVAEESGLIIEINDWVLRSAISAAARWRRAGHASLRVAVNVSSRQFFGAGFSERVSTLLVEHDLPPEALEIELTETVLQTGANTIEGLRRLQQLGVAVALDDFGTGYSSLASLEQLPLSRVKLDRSLIAGIDVSARSAAIANAIIRLCCDLGVQVTAEGVERCTQLAMLRDHRIHLQGYLLSRPLAESQLDEALRFLPAHLQSLLLDSSSTPSSPRVAEIKNSYAVAARG